MLVPACHSLLLVAAVALIPFAEGQDKPTLIQTHIVFRNGERAPDEPYPNDPNKADKWPAGLGQLTDVGKKDMYALGEFLRTRYDGFLSTDPQEILVRSSDEDRCIASAEVVLASFFKPEGEWVWNKELPWQPVPVHTVPRAADHLLNEKADCPTAEEDVSKIMETPAGKAYAEKYKNMFETVTRESGMTVNDPITVHDIYTTLSIEKQNGLEIPAWVEPIWADLTNAANEGPTVLNSSKAYERLRGGPLITNLTTMMLNREKEGDAWKLPNAFLYSTMDSVIAAFLEAMDVYNGIAVPFGATLLTELVQKGDKYFVNVFYRNTTDGEPQQLILPGCQADCPLADFTAQLKDFTVEDIQAECQK